MQTILDFLERHPNEIVVSMDDAKCIALFSVTGLLESFVKSDSPHLCVLTTDCHKTHWLVGGCWSGYPQGGNGYQAWCLPKSQFSKQGVGEFVDYVSETYGGYSREDTVVFRPDGWRKLN